MEHNRAGFSSVMPFLAKASAKRAGHGGCLGCSVWCVHEAIGAITLRLSSVDFGLKEFAVKSEKDCFNYYRRFVHEKGRLDGLEKEREKGFEINELDQ